MNKKSETNGSLLLARGVTLLELLAVVLILGILSTIATNVYVGTLNRARIAATQNTIREIEVAIARYEIDLGQFPPSGSADVSLFGGTPVVSNRTADGSGMLHLALVHSMSGSALAPISPLWQGPYISFQAEQLLASTTAGRTQILDAFLGPFQYVTSADYSADPFQGTVLFTNFKPVGAQPQLPINNPFLNETFYNPTTFQIYSFGPNSTTFGQGLGGMAGDILRPFAGTEFDDINNFGY